MGPCDTVTKHPFTSTHLMSRVTPKYDGVTTLYTPWATPSVTVAKKLICGCSHSSAHAHGTIFKGRNFKHFKTFIGRTR